MRVRRSMTTKTTVKSTWNLRGGICSLTGRPKIVCCTGIATGEQKERHSDYGDMGGCCDWKHLIRSSRDPYRLRKDPGKVAGSTQSREITGKTNW